ncbi:response regulator [Paucibacter sp. R3-3]|uniref:histidine kinase n=1 Tax=Roseateles agri TaxID=3098619 RepID=A0ABU5DGX8_9BURK|nr:response regulator [Paucibacter sp. R3-3]MDY0745404.1 response regulator [Paucibacter sp. R3-3]
MPLTTGFGDLPEDGADVGRANVLIVDDLPEKLLVIETILEELGQNLVIARSGTEALKEVLKQEFAVILLDVNMPGMDGLETARLLRTYRRSAHTPIIFITAYADELQTTQGYELGAVDYILSPVVAEVLRSKVRVFVELYISQRRLKLQALERIALATAEAAQRAAEESTRRSNFLAHASRVLTSSLDADVAMQRLLELVVPGMTSQAWLAMLGDAQSPGRLLGCSAVDGVPSFAEAGLDQLPQPLHDALLMLDESPARFGIGGFVVLPIVSAAAGRGARPLGALLVEDGAARLDGALLEELVDRAGLAFENARLYRNLQIEIVERRQAQQQLQDANQRKDEFLAMLSHELRNPLAPIRNAVEVIRRLTPGADKRIAWATDVTERQVRQLTRLVEELLDVARISQGKIVLRTAPLDLCAVVAHGVETVRELIDKRGHTLRLSLPHEPVSLQGDFARLAQVVANLLNNAAKYTEDGGEIEVALEVQGTRAQIRVRDNGLGIDAELLPYVFELFEQGKRSLDRSQGGLGVGLTLVQRLVHLHGGEVVALSGGMGLGSEFIVTLPGVTMGTTGSASPDADGAVAGTVSRSGCRVLVVDDNPDITHTIAAYLELNGYEVQSAADGMEAIALAASFAPDVVLLDIGLPLMDGYQVARQLYALPQTARSFLVALTGYGQSEDRRRAQEAGFGAHIVKPADPQALMRLIEDWLATRRSGGPNGLTPSVKEATV